MATIAENLHNVINAKSALMTSINAKNEGAIANSTPFSAYPNAIDAIEVGGIDMSDKFVTGCLEIKDYDYTEFLLSRCVTSVNIPNGVTSLGEECFRYSSLSEVTIPNSVTSLGKECFRNCSMLTSVTIGNSVKSLGERCFDSCPRLIGIAIPDSVTSLDRYCFSRCLNLTEVTCKATTPPTLGDRAFYNTPSTLVIYVPVESVDAYKSATNWSEYADKIQAIA